MKTLAIAFISAVTAAASTAMVYPSSSESIVTQMRRAIDLTQRANKDPSYAYEACVLWSNILSAPEGKADDAVAPMMSADAILAAHALYASALARVGRDTDAVLEYQTSLEHFGRRQAKMSRTEVDIRMGLGKSLQRLLCYREAKEVYMKIVSGCASYEELSSSYLEAAQRSILCSMRLGDAKSSLKIIDEFEAGAPKKNPSVTGMKGSLLLLQSKTDADISAATHLLKSASETSDSIIYKWLLIAAGQKYGKPLPSLSINEESVLQFAEINNSAFDDPFLIHLDDKILLHHVLKSLKGTDTFYPQSFVLPQDIPLFEDICDQQCRWMLKDRSGYGSHGNRIVSSAAAMDAVKESEILCQSIVDPPMLLDGRKFSLRIYVIYFPQGTDLVGDGILDTEVYISTNGLVKLASSEIGSTGTLEDQYMTNSGRGDGRSAVQYDLSYLRRELKKMNAISYEVLWNKIQQITQLVMDGYIALPISEQGPTLIGDTVDDKRIIIGRSQCLSCIPKILGFDFMLDIKGNPWLLEVNRFPGLEARSSMDATVKANVVYDSWLAAADRIGLEHKIIADTRPQEYRQYSLVKLKHAQ